MGSRADPGGLEPPWGSPDPPDTRPAATALTCPGHSSTNSAPYAGSSGGCPAPAPRASPALRPPSPVHRLHQRLEVRGNAWPVTVSSTGRQMQHLVSFANLLCRASPRRPQAACGGLTWKSDEA